jgi:glycosyltransferase involved in cell wall biosynthesis
MNILFIPHVPETKIINRVYEFAKMSHSLFLDWEMENSSLKAKIVSQVTSLFQPFRLENNILKIPLLFKPQNVALRWNTYSLNRAIKKYNIDVVVNANALLFDIQHITVPVIYDLVDDHLTPNKDVGLTDRRVEKIKTDIVHSRGVVCVTKALEEKVRTLNPNTITIENGLYIKKFQKAKSLKKELGLDGKKIFGYIGGVARWTGIDKACEAYMQIKNNTNAMIIVGENQSAFFQSLKEKYHNDILFVGHISPEKVGDYFKTLDIGLIPFVLNDFTNNAYPIKALEYALAGACVLSTPLKVLQSKRFPFIHFCTIEEFAYCMKHFPAKRFTYDFSELSWEKQSNKLIKFVEETIR